MITPIDSLSYAEVQYYDGDSGVDIHVPKGTPVRAVADGVLIYSEPGHTSWATPPDTANSILLLFHTPQIINGQTYNYAWYTHLSSLQYQVADGNTPRQVSEGTILGRTGLGNKVPHLHFGLLIRRAQNDGDFMPPSQLQQFMWDLIDKQHNKPEEVTKPVENVNRIKMFYAAGKKATVVLNGKEIEPASMTLEIVTKEDSNVNKAEISRVIQMATKTDIVGQILNLMGKLAPEILGALADGKIDQNELEEIMSELAAGIAQMTGKQLTKDEAKKLFEAVVILIRLTK